MRIRTVKPEFWTDSIMVQLPHRARLFFIGLWNVADDHGFIEDEPERLRMQLFPADPEPVDDLVELLVASERLHRIEHRDGARWLQIVNWEKHQRVDHPGKPRMPGGKHIKLAVPQAARRAIALKYGCPPGGEVAAQCYYCGTPGTIYWHSLSSGKPSGWVYFPGLEIDHFEAEVGGGANKEHNLILACRGCNRSKVAMSPDDAMRHLGVIREPSRALAPEKEKEKEGKRTVGPSVRTDPNSEFSPFGRSVDRALKDLSRG